MTMIAGYGQCSASEETHRMSDEEFYPRLGWIHSDVAELSRSRCCGFAREALVKSINETMKEYIRRAEEPEESCGSYGDINFLMGLMLMLHGYPEALSQKVRNKVPAIAAYCCRENGGKAFETPEEAICYYIETVSPESLGTFVL
ncbi:MAG: hypothetical protein LBB11_03510 [Puniceicoccales bacterium]|jgi:hypothetical protein|nr:hypothetical protein [Puniceicoccales bacterium]